MRPYHFQVIYYSAYFLEHLEAQIQLKDLYKLRLFFRKNGNIYLTKAGIQIFFLKFRFFSKEIFVKAFKFLINFMFICYYFFTVKQSSDLIQQSILFFQVKEKFCILTTSAFSSYIYIFARVCFCSLDRCNEKYNRGFLIILLIYFLKPQFRHVLFGIFF